MEKKIEITSMELKMLNVHLNGDFAPMTATQEECEAMGSVIEKADNLMRELDAYDELGNSLMVWFKNKWVKQQVAEGKDPELANA